MDPIWTKSNWNYGDLNDSSVEFDMKDSITSMCGQGTLSACQNPEGLLAVCLVVEIQANPFLKHFWTFPLNQSAIDRLAIHPDQSVAKLLLK